MGTTLSNGYKKPTTGDRGSSWFPDLESNIDRVNGHSHDGTDSELIEAKNITKASATISSASWGADSGGSTYSQTITLPTGWSFEDANMVFIDTSDDSIIYPTVVKASSTTYTVTVNDDTLTLTVVYH